MASVQFNQNTHHKNDEIVNQRDLYFNFMVEPNECIFSIKKLLACLCEFGIKCFHFRQSVNESKTCDI